MAGIIAEVFRPKKVLEIGCASGPTLYHLNTFFNVEAHGIDVSAWAVENRLHENVIQASADSLPFKDGEFDFIFSCHALEHLPRELAAASFAEISRVSSDDAIHLHLMPILGAGPYEADVFGSMVGLRTDLTHHLLRSREWWLEQWSKHGFRDSGFRVGHVYDNHSYEFSDCQLILTKTELSLEIARRISNKNLDVGRQFLRTLTRRPTPGLEQFLNEIREHWR